MSARDSDTFACFDDRINRHKHASSKKRSYFMAEKNSVYFYCRMNIFVYTNFFLPVLLLLPLVY